MYLRLLFFKILPSKNYPMLLRNFELSCLNTYSQQIRRETVGHSWLRTCDWGTTPPGDWILSWAVTQLLEAESVNLTGSGLTLSAFSIPWEARTSIFPSSTFPASSCNLHCQLFLCPLNLPPVFPIPNPCPASPHSSSVLPAQLLSLGISFC